MYNEGVGSWLQRRRAKSATKTALIYLDTRTSYGELADRVDRLANALRDRGVQQGDRVAYLGENDPSFLETFFAAGTLGAIFVPLNTRLAPPEIQFALQDSGATVLINAAALNGLAVGGSQDTAVRHRLVVRDTHSTHASDGAEDYAQARTAASADRIDIRVTLDDTAIILYTSGTTGRPKGAVLTHGNITWNSYNVLVDYDVVSSDVALVISPMFHVASLGMAVVPVFLKGGTLLLEPGFNPGRALSLIEQYKATMISGVPTTYQMLAEHEAWESTDLSSLKKLTCGGSAVPHRVMEAYESRGLSFSGGYGMTETAPGATSLQPDRSRDKMGSVGLPHFFTDVRIVDPLGSVQGPHTVGEIEVKGPNVIREYWNRPDATGNSFADDEWFRSGDMGYADDEGFIYISDRLKDMIISGGENIYPAEVEQIVIELEAIGSVALIGVPDEKWGEVPKAIITVRNGHAVTEAEVRAHLEGRLARYKIPKSVVIVDELPRTASGKIRKADLRQMYGES
ncbi:fatty-acyl-CoA synthase [Arthrobacter sp. V4I6]|uniref:acyl-CoA synthetase n=1 Tax=unclassified Arthrobacter TaxID=235627 RepID=UPI002785769E|nr:MULTISPECIES: long-chain fatty acid--CoA ligase [unclassified Arthrobacter]MDQ0821427.1 fatty-acyl-CoA synthase [Arthrobacter sp. V1I7]MDQ0855693.1 fatty-acyl-CoA synthase [Arthrobacter sp. V4I6]